MRGIRRLADKHSKFLGLLKNYESSSIGTSQASGIVLRKDGEGFAELVLDNPSQRNAVTAKMMLDLAGHVDHLVEDEELVGLCIRGRLGTAGRSIFCSGLDLNLAKTVVNSGERGQMMCMFMTEALDRIRNAPFVSAAVIGGAAIGGGMELATAADYRIVVQKAEEGNDDKGEPFFQSVHAKIGATPGWGGLRRSLDILGKKDSLSLFGTSTKMYPEDAMSLGLVDHIATWHADATGDSAEFDSFCSAQGRAFLEPFLCQPYPQSIRGMKSVISAAANDVGKVEEEVFRARWMGSDMQHALRDNS